MLFIATSRGLFLFLRTLSSVLALSILTACVSAPVAKRSPAPKPIVRPVVTPVAPAVVAVARKPLPSPPKVVIRDKPVIIYDTDPALNAPLVIPTRRAMTPTPSSNQDLVKRLRRGFAMPSRYHGRIDAQFTRYAGQQKYIDALMLKASRFMFIAITEAERRGLPTELALLPIIESAYDPSATSKSNAAGLWQFIPDTGRLYGLRQTPWFDARRDPLESTRAAYDYLAKLYDLFGDWELVLASYNAGPGTVTRAIKANAARGLATDYWSLNLPAEGMEYVPRFLAVVALFKDPSAAGVVMPALPNRPYFRTVAAQGRLDLDTVSALSGVSLDELRTLNAGLQRDQLAPDGPFLLHMPNSLDVASEHLLVQQSVPSAVRVVNAKGQPEAVVSQPNSLIIHAGVNTRQHSLYRVRRGDTWYSIARASELSPQQLALANNEQLDSVLAVDRELQIPTPAAAAYQAHLRNERQPIHATASRELHAPPASDSDATIITIPAGNRGL